MPSTINATPTVLNNNPAKNGASTTMPSNANATSTVLNEEPDGNRATTTLELSEILSLSDLGKLFSLFQFYANPILNEEAAEGGASTTMPLSTNDISTVLNNATRTVLNDNPTGDVDEFLTLHSK